MDDAPNWTAPTPTDGPAASPVPPSPPPPAGGPLSAEQLAQLEQANRRAARVRRAASVATFNAVILTIAAAGSALGTLVGMAFGGLDVPGAVVAAGLAVVAAGEWRGRRRLRRFDRRAPRALGWGQVALMVLLVGYGAWRFLEQYRGPNPYAQAIAAEPLLADSLRSIGQTARLLSLALYAGLIAGAILFQGLNALYYFSRAAILAAYLRDTPGWIVEIQRRTAGP